MKKWLLLAGLALVVVGGVGYYAVRQVTDELKCSSEDYRDLVEPLLDRWDDAEALASQTPRGSLPDRLSELQGIKREIENLDVPTCALAAHMQLTFYCDSTLDAYFAFMRQMSDDDITDDDIGALFTQASRHLDDWSDLVGEIDE